MDNQEKKSIGVEGKTVDDAIKKALKQLGVDRESVKIKIISEGKKGLFGMEGEKPAKIIVTLKNTDNIS